MVVPSRPSRIIIPPRLDDLLSRDRNLHAHVELSLSRFETWLEPNKVVFFREYTDHGPDHVAQVLSTASSLIHDGSWDALTPADAAAIVMSTALHDCAMHLREDGFATLVSEGMPPASAFAEGEVPWPDLWQQFKREAMRFNATKLRSLVGDDTPVSFELDRLDMTDRTRAVIGEFLRRHHARLAHEIALHGVPGPNANRLRFEMGGTLSDICGLIARSHNLPIREAADTLSQHDRRIKRGVHVPFVMAVLRIADYVQVTSERAPRELLQLERLRSPVSRGEWDLHEAVESLHTEDDDPEALVIIIHPTSVRVFLKAEHLLRDIQRELDESWAVVGEVYGPAQNLRKLGLAIRRVKSNLDDRRALARELPFIPEDISFSTAGADLLHLLVGPLYNYEPSIGIRELLQNAVDAVRERADLDSHFDLSAASVTIDLDKDSEGTWWLTVADPGVGMTVATIKNYFLRAGASFRNSDFWRQHHTTATGASRVLRAGRFGIGALAAFLLGDTIAVRTRNCGEAKGTEFLASLDDLNIELHPVHCEVGTTMRVRLSEDTAKLLAKNDEKWDWFVLSTPRVVRRLEGQALEQRFVYEGPREVLSPGAWRVDVPEFADIQWRFGAGYYAPAIICNGIRVDGPRYGWRDQVAPQLHSMIATPQVSVFDYDGNLPLNLQRSAIYGWPFRAELCDSVARDVVAYVIVNGSAANPTKLIAMHHPAMDAGGGDTMLSWLCCCAKGWTIGWEAPKGLPKYDRFVVATSLAATECVDLTRCMFSLLKENKSSDHYSRGLPFAETIAARMDFGTWFGRAVEAAAAFVAFEGGAAMDEFTLVRPRGRIYVGEEVFRREWGRSFKPTFNLRTAKMLMRNRRLAGIAEFVFAKERLRETPPASVFLKSWLKYTQNGVIPYDERERSKLAARDDLRPHIEYHQSVSAR